MLALAAQPPSSLKSVRRNSFTQTSPLLISFELLRTPIMMVFTSDKEGLPTTVILLSGASGSYSEYGVWKVTLLLPSLLALFLLIFKSVNDSKLKFMVLPEGHTVN